MSKLFIITDTREQRPLWQDYIMKLEVGDYTTAKLCNRFHIERKSAIDLYGSIIQNHRRFRDELILAERMNITLPIYVECERNIFVNLLFPSGGQRNMKPITLGRIITTMESQYEFVWCKDREDIKNKIIKRFKQEQRNGYV